MSRREGRNVLSRVLLRARGSRFYWPVTRRFERAGERFGLDWLIYNPLTFAYYHSKAVESSAAVADALEVAFPRAEVFVDLGAGTGAFAAELNRRGKTAIAFERSLFARMVARGMGVEARDLDLRRVTRADIPGADVVLCFEVAEHLPPDLGDALVRSCADTAPAVVFTAAPPQAGGVGHINEQPESYWIERFSRVGMRYDPNLTQQLAVGFSGVPAYWLAQDVMVFRAEGTR